MNAVLVLMVLLMKPGAMVDAAGAVPGNYIKVASCMDRLTIASCASGSMEESS